MRKAFVVAAALIVMALVATVTIVHLRQRDPSAPTASGDPAATDPVGRTSAVAVDGSVPIAVHSIELSDRQRSSLGKDWPTDLSLAVGVPVEIDGATIPDLGIVVTRRYIHPLPAQVSSTLAFYDPELPGWRAVPSRVASDRMSVSATVNHLSVWTDFVGGVGNVGAEAMRVVTTGMTALYNQVGKTFSERVDRPTCGGDRRNPDWVLAVTTIDDAEENPLRYCSGSDDGDLVVKVTVNRGFGFIAHPAKPLTSSNNTSYNEGDFADALQTAIHLDEQFGNSIQAVLGGHDLVGAGETLELTYDEEEARSAEPTIVTMEAPSIANFIFSVVARLTGTVLESKTDGWVSSGLALAQCASDLQHVKDGPSGIRAVITCASGMDGSVARQIVNYQSPRYDQAIRAGKKAKPVDGAKIGGLVGRISIWLTLIGPVLDTGDYVAAQNFDKTVRTVSLTTRPPSVTTRNLRNAEVPNACGLRRQRLHDNWTIHNGHNPGAGGSISMSNPAPVFADVAGRGYKQAVSSYACSQGGVGWPPVVILTGQGGELLGYVNLDKLTTRSYGDRGRIESLKTAGRRVTVQWSSSNGCCSAYNDHLTVLHWTGSGLAIEAETITRWAGDGAADDIIAAAAAGDRSRLLDRAAVSDDIWSRLVVTLRGSNSVYARGSVDGQRSELVSYEMLGETAGGDPITWTVVMAPAPNPYGWQMLSAEPE